MELFTRSYANEVRKSEGNPRKCTFVASDSTRDSAGTVVNQEGWNLKRFNSNGIIGYQHDVYGGWDNDPDKVIGKGYAYLEDGKLMVDVEFEPAEINPLAEKIYQKVLFGSLRAVSVGFAPIGRGHWGMNEESMSGSNPTFYFEGQELLEVSIVNIPANPNALKKSAEEAEKEMAYLRSISEENNTEEKPMGETFKEVEESTNEAPADQDAEQTAEVAEEQPAAETPAEEKAAESNEERSADTEDKKEVLRESNTSINNPNLTRMESNKNLGVAFTEAVNDAIVSRKAIVLHEERDLINAAGAEGVTPVTLGDIIEPLEKGTIMDKVGCKIQYGLEGAWKYPVVSYIEAAIAGESAEISDSAITIGKVEPNPQRVALSIAVTNKALAMGGSTLREIVLHQLAMGVTRLVNKWMLAPANVSTGVGGLFVSPSTTKTTTGVKTVTYAEIQALRGAVDAHGVVPDSTAAYVMSAATAALLRATLRGNADRMIIEDDKIDGIPVFISEYVGDATIEYGYFSYAMVGFFGDSNIVVDPFTLATSNQVRFVLNTHVDIKAARPEAFGKLSIKQS